MVKDQERSKDQICIKKRYRQNQLNDCRKEVINSISSATVNEVQMKQSKMWLKLMADEANKRDIVLVN